MKKIEAVGIDSIIADEKSKNNVTDKAISKWARKTADEIYDEFNRIDTTYDKKFDSLDASVRRSNKKYWDDLRARTDNVMFLLKQCSDAKEKKKLTEKLFEIDAQKDAFFETLQKQNDERKAFLIEQKNREDKKVKRWAVVKSAAPIFCIAVTYGIQKLAKLLDERSKREEEHHTETFLK